MEKKYYAIVLTKQKEPGVLGIHLFSGMYATLDEALEKALAHADNIGYGYHIHTVDDSVQKKP